MNTRCTDYSSLYRDAAKLMEEYDGEVLGCCDAIGDICPAATSGARCTCQTMREKFHEVFRPNGPQCAYYFGEHTAENRGPRVLALGFMAAMVETGDA